MGYRNYATAKGHIVSPLGDGDFTTITAALTAASSGQTIFLRPGTYTENLTLKAGVNLVAYNADAVSTGGTSNANVIIKGTITASYSGTASISGINLQTNGAAALTWSGSNTLTLRLTNCWISANDSTAITGNNSNAEIDLHYCVTQGASTNLIFSITNVQNFVMRNCIGSAGASNIISTIAAGTCRIVNSNITFALATTSSGAYALRESSFRSSTAVSLALVGTGVSSVNNCGFDATENGGSTAAITVGAGTTLNIAECQVGSNAAANAITGAGTINAGPLSFTGTANVNTVTTQGFYAFGNENTYTPVLSFGGASVNITYATQLGKYLVIGNLCFFNVNIVLTSKGISTGTAAITLPFTAQATHPQVCPCISNATFPATTSYYSAFIAASSTTLAVRGAGSATITDCADTNFSNTTNVRVSGCYLLA